MTSPITEFEILHYHGFHGLGGGAKGFNKGRAEIGAARARFRCIGGFDSDPAAVRDFQKATGVPGTCLDLFDYQQYLAFHGHKPPAGWCEAIPEDIRRSAGNERPHIIFLSAPCKGFSGLLSESKSRGDKYQALNRLTLRGVWLMLEAWKDDPAEFILFENVPRIATRGRGLLDQIGSLLRAYGYNVAETTHDCGELGGLAQSRKRFLLVARHVIKVPPFLYEPPKRPLRAVGDILGKMPMPGHPAGGPMHSLPNLQWKTWVRLAFVEAGSDWRSLNKLSVIDGKLADYLVVPEPWYNGVLGVNRWEDSSGTVTGNARPITGPFAVADPRQKAFDRGFGVCDWDRAAKAIQGQSLPSNGEFAVADPRFVGEAFSQYGVCRWAEPSGAVTSQRAPGQGPISVADPRMPQSALRQNGIYRVVRWDGQAGAVTGASHVAGAAMSIADPRPPLGKEPFGKYAVSKWARSTGTVIGGDDSGAYAVADPRPAGPFSGKGKYRVTPFDAPTNTVIAQSTTGHGSFGVADPRVLNREKGDAYLTGGHFGVVPWTQPSGTVSGAACHDNGPWSVADPRLSDLPAVCPVCCSLLIERGMAIAGPICQGCSFGMPKADQKLVCVIRALDGTWHRPFTTLELAALQSLVDPDEYFDLDGNSDSAKRERIGNAVPPHAAQAIADLMGETLLRAWTGETFVLSSLPVWVRPIGVALSVKSYLPEE